MTGKKRAFFKRRAHQKKKAGKPASLENGHVVDDADNSEVERESAQKKVRWKAEDVEEENRSESINVGADREDSGDDNSTHAGDDKVVLATYAQHFRVGCACYDPVKMVVCVLEDSVESFHHDTTRLLLEQVTPDVILTSTRADETSIDVIREYADIADGVFQVRPGKEFTPAKGRDRLLSLSFLSELPLEESTAAMSSAHSSSSDPPTNAYDFMRRRRELAGDPSMKRWNASIRLGNFASLEECPLCLSAIGALLDHLAKVRAMADLESEGVCGLEIRGIEAICLEKFMHINADALCSLSVFETESHASAHSDKTKEGLSLFGILNNTRTTLGRFLLRQWLLRPSLSLSVISARHDAVECLNKPENIVTADALSHHLKGLKNVPRMLKQLKSGKAGLNEWQGLVKFTFHASLLREALIELSYVGEVDILKTLVATLDVTSFREVGNAIHETVDWEESVHSGRVSVRPNIDEELDKWKHIYNGIDGVLSRVASQLSETVPAEYTTSLNVVYFPQLGFLICIPMKEGWSTESGIDVLDGWSFQFSSETHIYFKSGEMHDMDRHIGDLHPSIVDREIEILQTLLDKILESTDVIVRACDACAELDCLLCFAEASRLHDYRRPNMTDANVLHITQGRHPLQEQVVDTFVPNDVHLMGGVGLDAILEENIPPDEYCPEDTKSVLVLTGANACGKSVYLKQTALIQYMAQIGWSASSRIDSSDTNITSLSFVPAESATLGIVDKSLFTRVQTRESVSKVQSAFMIDLNQVSLALRNSTPRSLILLDEFGKGTKSSDGAGLMCGVIRSLLARGAECPKVLVATHFHEIFHADLLDQCLPITFLHMQILIPDLDDDDVNNGNDEKNVGMSRDDADVGADVEARLRLLRGETITYLYRVAPDLSLESHAARCAQMFGLPPAIVRRAQYVSSLLSTHNITRLLDEDMTLEEVEDLAQAEAICRRFIDWDLNDLATAVESVGFGGVKARLGEILGRNTEEPIN